MLDFSLCNSQKDEDAAGIGEASEKIEELLLAPQSLPDVTALLPNYRTSSKGSAVYNNIIINFFDANFCVTAHGVIMQ